MMTGGRGEGVREDGPYLPDPSCLTLLTYQAPPPLFSVGSKVIRNTLWRGGGPQTLT